MKYEISIRSLQCKNFNSDTHFPGVVNVNAKKKKKKKKKNVLGKSQHLGLTDMDVLKCFKAN